MHPKTKQPPPRPNWKATGRTLTLLATLSLSACAPIFPWTDPRVPPAERLFERSCAGCHGSDARGNGPVAEFLSAPVPDLTQIARRHGRSFPDLEIYRIIDGLSEDAGPGSRHMPIWGYEYFGNDADDELAHRRATRNVQSLVDYLRGLQQ